MNYNDNVARLEQAVEEFIVQEKLDKNTQVLDPVLGGIPYATDRSGSGPIQRHPPGNDSESLFNHY